MLNATDKRLLEQVADLHEIPHGAYNIRKNGKGLIRNTTANIDIITKTDKPGIDVIIKPGTKGESVHIPVIMSLEGLTDVVYNTFEVGEGADVLIVAGCGIHNSGKGDERHDGIHEFFVRRGARMKYVEKHYGEGDGIGKRILNPKTIIEVEEDAVAELEMVQIKGVDSAIRDTEVVLHKNARLIVSERMLTYLDQQAESNITVSLKGEDSSAQIISRSVAQNDSKQVFHLNLRGYARCRGNAAVPAEALAETDEGDTRCQIETDFTSYLVTTQKAAERMEASSDIVLIGSMSAVSRKGGSSIYVAAKSGIQGFAKSLREELAERDIKVGLIEPGFTGADFQYPDFPPDKQVELINAHKMLRAEDIAVAAHYMLTQPRRTAVSLMRVETRLEHP